MFSFSHFQKKIQIPLSLTLSLSSPSLFLSSAQNSSLSPTDDAGTPANRAPSLVENSPHLVGKLQAFRYSFILSLSLAASLFLSPHLAGITVPLSLLHCLISVSLATTSHCRDSFPQIFSHTRVLNEKEVRIVSDT